MTDALTPAEQRFPGCWRLSHVRREVAATGEKLDADVTQAGYISYTPDRRVMVILSRARAGMPDEITCYAARWSVEGDHIFHDVDIASRAPWAGTRQTRGYRFEGGKLTLSPPVSADFIHGVVTRRSLVWERVAPGP